MLTVDNVKHEIIEWATLRSDAFLRKNNHLCDLEMFANKGTFEYAWREFYAIVRPNNRIPYQGTIALLNSGEAMMVDCFGGENLGNKLWLTFSLAGQFFRMDGTYDSYGGNNWMGSYLDEVYPKTSTRIIYVPKGS